MTLWNSLCYYSHFIAEEFEVYSNEVIAMDHLADKCQSGIQPWHQGLSSWHNSGWPPWWPEHIGSSCIMVSLVISTVMFSYPFIVQMEPTVPIHQEHLAGTSIFKPLWLRYTFWKEIFLTANCGDCHRLLFLVLNKTVMQLRLMVAKIYSFLCRNRIWAKSL